jgi:thiol-disulfide isomerase/thioredoxin
VFLLLRYTLELAGSYRQVTLLLLLSLAIADMAAPPESRFATYGSLIHHRMMRIRMGKWGVFFAGILVGVVLSVPLFAQGDLVGDVRTQLARNSFSGAESELRAYKSRQGVTPEYLEALSWMARGAAAVQQWDQAAAYANETRTLAEQQLTKRKLDSEPHLPVAVGAAYEVLAQEMEAKGQHAKAVSLLRSALTRYGTTSIRARLQKNLNLIALVGQPAPPLQIGQYLGPKPPALASLKGSPVLLFFWAHWCVDCKAEAPVIARLRQEFAPQGLVVIGPTQLYGYAAQGADAAPEQERAYIESVRTRYYASLQNMPAPLSKLNFDAYGASTTPTLVVLNRAGRVEMYHPGALSYEELRGAIQKVVAR